MARKSTLQMRRMVDQRLLNLSHLATIRNDTHLCDFLEHHHLLQDVKFTKNLAESIINLPKLRAPGDSLAESSFGNLTLGDSKNRAWTERLPLVRSMPIAILPFKGFT